jgi:hypothetical protein
MIEALKGLDRITALGVVSRAALAVLSSDANPSAQPVLEHEAELRKQLILEVANRFGLSLDLSDENVRNKLSDVLDEEAEILDFPVDSEAALTRLSERGKLPSDVFDIFVNDALREVYGDAMEQEHQNILLTVRSPEAEEHFGPCISPERTALVSLFGRRFPAQPRRASFYHLVAGERSGTKLEVKQAWRIYEDEIDLRGVRTLIETVKLFAEKYGATFKSGDQVGRFIPWVLVPPYTPLFETVEGVPPKYLVRTSMFMKVRPDGFTEVAFASRINVSLYSGLVHRRDALRRDKLAV